MSELISPERILKRIGITALCILLFVYAVKQLVGLFNSNIETETALAVTYEDSLELEGYIMRKETVLLSDTEGTMLATVKDGERVSNGKEVVRIYYTENDFSTENDIRNIDDRIEILEKSSIDTSYVTTDMDKMDEEINEILSGTLIHASENDLVGALSRKDDLLIEMNQRWLLSNPGKSYEGKLKELRNERTMYSGRLTGTSKAINTAQSGYYYSSADGYENIFSSEHIVGLTVDKFMELKNSSPEVYSGKVAGKIVTDHRWYIVCPVTSVQADNFETGNTYSIEFAYNYGTVLDLNLQSKVSDSKNGTELLVFVSNEVPQDFEFSRMQKVKIIYKKHTGLKIPKDAMRVVDNVKGVYVVNGTEIEFKRAEEIYSFDDYYIIDSDPESPKYSKKYPRKTVKNNEGKNEVVYYGSLSLYDSVVVKGKDIYDGMKIE